MSERNGVRARVARDRVPLVTRRAVIEPDDVGQILDRVAVAIDIDDVADVRAVLAAERVDRRISGHDEDGP